MADNKPQKSSTHEPFDHDVDKFGGYAYTSGSILSARMANERYTKMILSAVDFRGKAVIDVGSGDGTYTAELARLSGARSIMGVEPSSAAATRSREHFKEPGLEYRAGYLGEILSEGKRFDVAVFRGVLHHAESAENEISVGLQIAETIVVLEPNGWNPLMKAAEKLSAYHREHREKSFFPEQLCRWITAQGGAVESVIFFGLVPYFCSDAVARLGRALEPFVERLPLLRRFVCGQYLLVGNRNRRL